MMSLASVVPGKTFDSLERSTAPVTGLHIAREAPVESRTGRRHGNAAPATLPLHMNTG